jgi:LCP family protein required for cell wall assembly
MFGHLPPHGIWTVTMTDREPARATGSSGSGTPPRTARRWRRRILVGLLVVTTASALVVATVFLMTEQFADDVKRIPDPFAAIPEATRPAQPVDTTGRSAVTFLVAGVDTRSEVPTTGAGAAASGRGVADAVILARLSGDRQHAYVVSIPRDTVVPIPSRGYAKINEAYAYGGPSLLITTIERLTDVRIDHVAVIDFAGFRELTDALGGVTVSIREDTYDPYQNRVWQAGTHSLDGKSALDYVRQRKGLPRGDLDRAQRHQVYLRALMNKLVDTRTLANPVRLSHTMDAISQTVRVDANLTNGELRELLLGLRGLDPDQVMFATVPVTRAGDTTGTDVLRLDTAAGGGFWAAFENDELPAHVARAGADMLGPIEN